jgi:hypothetical protein
MMKMTDSLAEKREGESPLSKVLAIPRVMK